VRIQQEYVGGQRKDLKGQWKRLLTVSFIICPPHQIVGLSYHGDDMGMTYYLST